MEKENVLFEKFIELRNRYSLEDLILIFTKTKALAFESEALRLKFFSACEVG